MKRCPECRRDYYDDTLLYCLEDGNELVQGSVPSPDEPATAILSEFGVPPLGGSVSEPGAPSAAVIGFRPDEAQTRPHILTTDQTAIFPRGMEAEPQGSLGGLSEKRSFSARRIAKPLVAALAVLVVAGIGFGIYKFAGKKESAPSFESMKITKLTDTGKAGSAAISPDGKYVVHVKKDAGHQSLWVRHIATGSNVQIITDQIAWFDLSHDGKPTLFSRGATTKDVVLISGFKK
jgi:hypothetical protein